MTNMLRSLVRVTIVVVFTGALWATGGLASVAAAVNTLLIEHDVTIGSMVSDRFTWRDAANQTRVAVLAHNDGQVGPGGTRGGELREYRYETPGGTRTVQASSSFAAGFGYVVSHRSEGTSGLLVDDSPLGHFFPGQFQRVFEGRHHAIFRFTQLYPRYSKTTAVPPNTQYDVPVTVEWVFSTGEDNPLWAVTWNLSGVPVNAVEADTRAPYGELLFDGATTEGAHSLIAGVGWGDRYKFVSTSNPVTYNSAWTWNTPNTVPYVKLWTTLVDATLGTVQTQTIAQQDAGGYYGASRWNSTSAAGNACDPLVNVYHDATHLMPCDFNWPYQSINYSLSPLAPGSPTNNTRLAWGANFGFLGQSAYLVHGSASNGGPLPDAYASGYPKKSYSTHVVLGRHSVDPVGAQVAQIETTQGTALTAAIGGVVTTGPAGVNRGDNITYSPAGWNHVYAAWALQAAGNQVDANFAVSSGTLKNPRVIVSNWTAGVLPSAVRWNGATLAQDTDYFPSVRTGANELWITLNKSLAGFSNHLEISAGCAPGGAFDTDGDSIPDTVESVEGTNPCAKDNDVFTSTRLFAMQQYRDFLGREGDTGGLAVWTANINAGMSRAQVTKSFFDSPEFQGAIAPVTRLYFAYFNRIPDKPGLDYWIGQYRAGMPIGSISQAFAASPEFIATYGSLDNNAFVTLVYNNVLGRAPDAVGFAYWTGQLTGGLMTRGQVMVGFSESPEYQQTSYNRVFVTMTYYGMLRRVPEQLGFDYWVANLNAGVSTLNLINGFLAAPEYHGRFLP